MAHGMQGKCIGVCSEAIAMACHEAGTRPLSLGFSSVKSEWGAWSAYEAVAMPHTILYFSEHWPDTDRFGYGNFACALVDACIHSNASCASPSLCSEHAVQRPAAHVIHAAWTRGSPSWHACHASSNLYKNAQKCNVTMQAFHQQRRS